MAGAVSVLLPQDRNAVCPGITFKKTFPTPLALPSFSCGMKKTKCQSYQQSRISIMNDYYLIIIIIHDYLLLYSVFQFSHIIIGKVKKERQDDAFIIFTRACVWKQSFQTVKTGL